MTMTKKILVWMLLTISCLLLASCKKSEKGMQAAWESMQALSKNIAYKSHLYCNYDEPTDTLSIQLNSLMDPDVLFDELDKAFKGADLGNLVFELFYDTYEDDYLEKLSARLGKLRCKSIRCLAFGHMILKDDAWTAILDRTEILFNPPLKDMTDYSETGMTNLAHVRKLWITDTASSSLKNVSVLTELEEITISAGLTAAEQEKTREALEQAHQRSYSNSSVYESDIYQGIFFFQPAKDLENLKRVLFYPDLDSWEPDTWYYMNILSMQSYIPDVYTNAVGAKWSDAENTLVAPGSIDVLELAGDNRIVSRAFDHCLSNKARACYAESRSFTESANTPSLKGTCLVYMASPKNFDSEGNPVDEFFTVNFEILRDDFFESPDSADDPITTFVYVYPEYSYYGKYTDGTKAYRTATMVQVCDMEQMIRYTAMQADVRDPSKTIYTDGSGSGSSAAVMWSGTVLDFLKNLQ